jgi:hypothetical protein
LESKVILSPAPVVSSKMKGKSHQLSPSDMF